MTKKEIKSKSQKKRREETRIEEEKPRFERVSVWVPVRHRAPTSSLDFNWPDFTTDRERIKMNSLKFKDVSITEAFEANGVEVSKSVSERANTTPAELRVGQVIPAHIMSITKNGVVFDSTCVKQNMVCNTNLYKYEKFRKFLPVEDVPVKVLSTDQTKVVVDPLVPIFDEWINTLMKDFDVQRNIKEPKTIKVKNLRLTRGGFIGKAVIPPVSKFVGDDYTIDAFIPGSQIVLNIESDFSRWEGKTVDAFVTNYMIKPGTANEMSLICSTKDYLKFQGDQYLINLFNHYCLEDEEWKAETEKKFNGVVTGIINSAKKCGVFIEVPVLHITGMISMNPEDLVNYKPQQSVDVRVVDFEDLSYFDNTSKQIRHSQPYCIEDDIIRDCILKPVLQLV